MHVGDWECREKEHRHQASAGVLQAQRRIIPKLMTSGRRGGSGGKAYL